MVRVPDLKSDNPECKSLSFHQDLLLVVSSSPLRLRLCIASWDCLFFLSALFFIFLEHPLDLFSGLAVVFRSEGQRCKTSPCLAVE